LKNDHSLAPRKSAGDLFSECCGYRSLLEFLPPGPGVLFWPLFLLTILTPPFFTHIDKLNARHRDVVDADRKFAQDVLS
jgi:hypothetical protein